MSCVRDIVVSNVAQQHRRSPGSQDEIVRRYVTLCRSMILMVQLGIVVAWPAEGQVGVRLGGYAKNLSVASQSLLDQSDTFLNLSRLRLRTEVTAGAQLEGEIWLDTELLLGSYIGTLDYELSRLIESPAYFDLEWTVSDGSSHVLQQRLFRVNATLYAGRYRLVAGRQRVGWGSGFVWTPTDLLNPISPASIERSEEGGVDALYGVATLGPLSQAEIVWAPGRDYDGTSVAGRIASNWREFDVSIMGGYYRRDVVLGGDFAGYVQDSGLRGEWTFTARDTSDNFFRLVLNADHNFPGGYYTFVELYHNGAGTRNKSEYDFSQILGGGIVTLAREYGALSVSKQLSPLVSASLYSFANLNDGSGLFGPAVTWSAATNLEIAASAYLFFGGSDTEYGGFSHVFFGSLQYFY
jgi:hypothetical protein